jgi:hypothetical protein
VNFFPPSNGSTHTTHGLAPSHAQATLSWCGTERAGEHEFLAEVAEDLETINLLSASEYRHAA